jgi:hypothetical protein
VRSEQQAPASEVPGFAAMNHTTRLRETRNGHLEAEDYAVDDFGIEKGGQGNESLSEE